MTEQMPCVICHLPDPLSKSSVKSVPVGVEIPPVPVTPPVLEAPPVVVAAPEAPPVAFAPPPEVPPVVFAAAPEALVSPPVLVVALSALEPESPQATRDRLAKHVAKAKVVLVIDHLLLRTG
jgi:hypothetical protein